MRPATALASFLLSALIVGCAATAEPPSPEAATGVFDASAAAVQQDRLRAERLAEDGRKALSAGNPEEAIGRLSAALDLWPSLDGAHADRGRAFSLTGEAGAALADLTIAIGESPGDAGLYELRGNIRASTGDAYGALLDMNRAIELDGSRAEALRTRGDIKYGAGDVNGALDDYRRARAGGLLDAALVNNLANALAELGRIDEAIGEYTTAIGLDPSDPVGYLNRATAYVEAGDAAHARADIDAVRARTSASALLTVVDALEARLAQDSAED